jgi:molybdopterin synthase catalytic subunit
MIERVAPRRFEVTADVLDVAAIAASISTAADGAVASFVGLVRVGVEADARWPAVRLAIHHRTGRLRIGEASVVVAAASPHRADAFAACRYAIERVKQIAPVWKHEHFEGGDVWIEGATADPDDESARTLAFERACS